GSGKNAPVGGIPHVFGSDFKVDFLIIGFQVDEWSCREFVPLVGHGTFIDPIDHTLLVVVAGLVAYDIQPVLVFIKFAYPGTASRVLCHDSRMLQLPKDPPAYRLPSLLKNVRVLPI